MRIVFFGDSVTEGCFEIFANPNGGIDGVKDIAACYVNLLSNRLKEHFPNTEFDIVNAGVGGNTSADGLARIEKDVINKKPDIAVVCFGLNDVGLPSVEEYRNNMCEIFGRLKAFGIKTVFMTPNMINTYVHHLNLEILNKMAKNCAQLQNDGTMDLFIQTGRECAEENGAVVCDAYAVWKKLGEYGVNTTELLCNYINHPIRPMHRLFADLLEPVLIKLICELTESK